MIHGEKLEIKTYEGVRVVTFADIARVHRIPVNNLQRNFQNNRKHLLENEDFFVLKSRDQVEKFSTCPESGTSLSKLYLFTASGYLMLVKSLSDDLSWEVQRELVNSYFKLKQKQVEIGKMIQAVNNACRHNSLSEMEKSILYRDLFRELGVPMQVFEERVSRLELAEVSESESLTAFFDAMIEPDRFYTIITYYNMYLDQYKSSISYIDFRKRLNDYCLKHGYGITYRRESVGGEYKRGARILKTGTYVKMIR